MIKHLLTDIKNNKPYLSSLDLSYQALTDDDIAVLTEALASNTYLTSLNVAGNRLSLASIQRITRCKTLQMLDLSGCELTADCAPYLARMPILHTLKINYNQLKAEGATHIVGSESLRALEIIGNEISDAGAKGLANNCYLTSLNAASNNISDDGAIALAERPALIFLALDGNQIAADGGAALARNDSLETLLLCHNYLGNEGSYPFKQNTTLRALTVGYNNIGLPGIEALASHVALKRLGVAGNGIPEGGAKMLAKNKHITWLDVSYNQIDDLGTEAIGDNTTFEYLNLSYNYAYAEGAQYLAKHPKLRTLILSYNAIGDSGLEPFKDNTILAFLDVTGCEITAEGAVSIARNTTLETLLMDFNNVGDEGALSLANNLHLRRLSLGYNAIGDKGGLAFASTKTLTYLSLAYNPLSSTSREPLQHNQSIQALKITSEQPPDFNADRLKRLFLMSQEFLCVLDSQGIIQFFNPAFSRTLNYAADALLAKPLKDFVYPADKDLQPIHVNHKIEAFTLESRYLRQNGDFRIIHWRCHMVSDKIYTVGRDITEQRKAEIKLQERDVQNQLFARRTLQDKLYLQKQADFIAHLCHEIRNPLSGTVAYLYVLNDYIQAMEVQLSSPQLNAMNDDWQLKMLAYIKNIKQILANMDICTEHQRIILDNNLDVSMLEANQLILNTAEFDPKAIIADAIKILRGKAYQKQLKIYVSLPDEELLLKGDAYRFKQIVLNLLGNAIKFTHKGYIKVALTVLEQAAKQMHLSLKVKDTGIGMTSEEMSRLFHRFSQANLSVGSSYGGSGLGLFIAQRLAGLMGGQIKVKSTLGKGTTFICDVRFEQLINALSEQITAQSQLTSISALPYTILIVDDNTINQQALKTMLEFAGHTCILANDGQEAIAVYAQQPVDIIFMDILMPRMNGIEATFAIRRLEKQQQRNRVPIVALSGNAQAQDKKEALAAGMNDYVTKPFKREQIYQKIMDLCQTTARQIIER
jgi:PAS domain S-box-containing protein